MLQEDEEATFRKDEFAKEYSRLITAACGDGSFEETNLETYREAARQHVEKEVKKQTFNPMPDKDRIEELIGNIKKAEADAETFLAPKRQK